mmetsp:Transcript_57474/g.128325  ORF Transcript_57474/g.128325 Transcript_57474/m.128325 type:complete len:114 (-) Transcript_57474:291-632(-)
MDRADLSFKLWAQLHADREEDGLGTTVIVWRGVCTGLLPALAPFDAAALWAAGWRGFTILMTSDRHFAAWCMLCDKFVVEGGRSVDRPVVYASFSDLVTSTLSFGCMCGVGLE